MAKERAELTAKGLDPQNAVAGELWPRDMIRETDSALDRFEAAVGKLTATTPDTGVFKVVKLVVRDLNAVDDRYEGSYETAEREELCKFIEGALEAGGVDVDAVASRRGLTRQEITDKWRQW